MPDYNMYDEIIPRLLDFWFGHRTDQPMELDLFVGLLNDAFYQRQEQVEDAKE